MEKPKMKYNPAGQSPQRLQNASGQHSGFHVGDALLIWLAVLLATALILFAAVIVPAVRENFREYDESLLFTIEIFVTPEDLNTLPKPADSWVLLDSNDAVCTVRTVDYTAGESSCRITLLRKSATYREGEGYMIEGTRIAVGSTLYFLRDSGRYFAASVTSVSSDRFPLPETDPPADTSEQTEAVSLPSRKENAYV